MKLLTIMSAIGVIASMGGYEQGMFRLAGLFLRLLIFGMLTVINFKLENIKYMKRRN